MSGVRVSYSPPRGINSVVECQPSKLNVRGSNPLFRFPVREHNASFADVSMLFLLSGNIMGREKYQFGGLETTSINVLRLLSELEGSFQLCKYMGFEEDMNTISEMKQRYYKLYFKLNKEERNGV